MSSEKISKQNSSPAKQQQPGSFFDSHSAGFFGKKNDIFFSAVKTKLEVSQPGDAEELEADRVAEKVMRMDDDALHHTQKSAAMKSATHDNIAKENTTVRSQQNTQQAKPFFGTAQPFFKPAMNVKRKCDACEQEDKLQRKEDGGSTSPAASVGRALQSSGSSLPVQTQQFFKQRLGKDFSNVRVHTSTEAAESAADVHAKAYTVGNDIVFNKGRFDPATTEGKLLLAHELVHVIQNEKQDAGKLNRAPEDEQVAEPDPVPVPVSFGGVGLYTENSLDFGCEGVSVQGVTSANYSNSFASSGTQVRATGCAGCEGAACVTSTGNVVSTFRANPTVSLPSVPSGLTACETAAVQTFISTTLSAHEQDHVTRFRTYSGTVTTPYTFTGCVADLNSYVQSIHDGIEVPRRDAANALSDAIDPFNATIPCDCPDAETEAPE
jgi:hypothetical protein